MGNIKFSAPTARVSFTQAVAKIKMAPVGSINTVSLGNYVRKELLYGTPVTVPRTTGLKADGGLFGSIVTTDRGDPVTMGG